MNQNELYHYGVLGMKWGRRRYQNADGSLTSKGRKHYGSDDHIKTAKIKKKKLHQMTNQELRDLNNRLQLETQYKNLTRKKSVGKRAVETFIGTAGTIAAARGAYKTYAKVAKIAIKKWDAL